MSKEDRYYGTGRRKSAVARVWIKKGTGKFGIVNKFLHPNKRRTLDEYFGGLDNLKQLVMQPFEATDTVGKFDVYININGGGVAGQAGAIRHGITRALLAYNNGYKPVLRRRGYLTRDPRVKERKKYGQPGARKKYQYSKR